MVAKGICIVQMGINKKARVKTKNTGITQFNNQNSYTLYNSNIVPNI